MKQKAVAKKTVSKAEGMFVGFTKPTKVFTRALAAEIVKNLTTLGQMTSRPFRRSVRPAAKTGSADPHPVYVDTSVLVDARILAIAQSGFLTGTLYIPKFILSEVQHIADSRDNLRRTKGRRALDVVGRLVSQKVNPNLKVRIVDADDTTAIGADDKLLALAKRQKDAAVLTVDFNLAQVARARGIRVLHVHSLAQAMRVALVPGEELSIFLAHAGSQRQQGVGYLADGTMVVVENSQDKVGTTVQVVVTKVHQTPAGQLFFARLVS